MTITPKELAQRVKSLPKSAHRAMIYYELEFNSFDQARIYFWKHVNAFYELGIKGHIDPRMSTLVFWH